MSRTVVLERYERPVELNDEVVARIIDMAVSKLDHQCAAVHTVRAALYAAFDKPSVESWGAVREIRLRDGDTAVRINDLARAHGVTGVPGSAQLALAICAHLGPISTPE